MLFALGVLFVVSSPALPMPPENAVHLMLISSSADGEEHCLEDGVLPAVQLAVDHVNDNEEILKNYQLSIVMKENSSLLCNRKRALDVLHESLFDITSTPQLAIIGAGCSRATEAVAEFSHYYNLPMISYASSSGTLDDANRYPYLSRMIPTDDLVAMGMAVVIFQYGWKKAAVITQNLPEFTSMTNRLHQELNSTVNLTDILFPNDSNRRDRVNFFPSDVRIFLLNVQISQARWILCKAFHSLKWREYRYVWLMQGWYEDLWWNVTSSPQSDSLDVNCTGEDLRRFLHRQRVLGVNHYPRAPNKTTPTIGGLSIKDFELRMENFAKRTAFAYDAVWSIALGLNATIAELGNDTADLKAFSPPPVTADHCGDFDSLNRDWEPGRSSYFGTLLRDKIFDAAFEGVSGYVTFENGTRSSNGVRVYQYGEENQREIAIILNSEGGSKFEYADGESDHTVWPNGTPSDGTPVEIEKFPYLWLVVTSYVFNSIVIVAALVCLVFTILFRKRKLVKLTSPNLNCVVIVGVIVFSLSSFMFVYPRPISTLQTRIFCFLRIWLVSIGMSLCFGTINAKMGRLYYIFHNPEMKKKVIKELHLFLVVVGFILVDLLILIPTTASKYGRFHPERVPDVEHPNISVDCSGNPVTYIVTLCSSSWRQVILGILFGYKAVIQAIGLTLAFRLRNIEIETLNDSKEMTLALFLSSAILIVIVIISMVFGDHLNLYGASYSYGIPLCSTAVLAVVFFSKMIRLYQDPNGVKIFSSSIQNSSPDSKVMKLEERIKELTMKLEKVKGIEAGTSLLGSSDHEKIEMKTLT